MQTIPFTITKKDYENSSKSFMDISNCPLAVAAKRVLKLDEVRVSPGYIAVKNSLGFFKDVAELQDGFGNTQFRALERGKEFSTILTIY